MPELEAMLEWVIVAKVAIELAEAERRAMAKSQEEVTVKSQLKSQLRMLLLRLNYRSSITGGKHSQLQSRVRWLR